MRHPVKTLLCSALVLVALASSALADFSRKVTASFRGQIVVSTAPLPNSGKNDKATIDAIKKARLAEIDGREGDVKSWTFNYTAFLNKGGATSLKLKFFTADKEANYVADQSLSGIDPKSNVLAGEVTISEDEGLTRGKSYTVKLVTDADVTLATTTLKMK